MIYGSADDPGRSHGGWETKAAGRQTDTSDTESLAMKSLFNECGRV